MSARFFPDDLTGAVTESRALIDVIAPAAKTRPDLAEATQALLSMKP